MVSSAQAVPKPSWAGLAIVLLAPVVGLVLLLSAPSIDPEWDHEPSHFWLVLGTAAVAGVLGWSVSSSARRRSDARLFLVSISFSAAAAFLGLHALATPRVIVPGTNMGFVVAVPVGLALASVFAVWSAAPLDGSPARWIVARTRGIRGVLGLVVVVWAIVSLAELPPLDDPTPAESGSPLLLALGVPAMVGFGFSAWRYLAIARARRSFLLISVAAAWVLLGEAALAVSITENWRVSWWEWHVLMVVAFASIAVAAARMPEFERFSDLYLDEVAGGTREISVLFADLEGFTSYSEEHEPEEVRTMLNTFFEAVLPAVRNGEGRVDRFMGDAVMVTFNVAVDQPDHARRAVEVALDFRDRAERVARSHPGWPRARVGINTGPAGVGVIGDGSERGYTVVGDTVNVASRIEGLAPVGGIAISDTIRRAVPGVRVVSLGPVSVKNRREPLEIWRLDDFDG